MGFPVVMTDRRRHARLLSAIRCTLRDDRGAAQSGAIVRELDARGARVTIDRAVGLAPSAPCTLIIASDERRARVAWVQGREMGLELLAG